MTKSAKTLGYIAFIGSVFLRSVSLAEIVPSEAVAADDQQPDYALLITSQDIFKESDPNTQWIHKLANRLHINTRPEVIRDRLPTALLEDPNPQTIAEAKRVIRALPYIYDSKIELESDASSPAIKVQSSDRWTILPNLFFNSAGGQTNTTVGLSDDNFLGRGIHAGISYTDNTQRTGVLLDWNIPLSNIRHASVSGALADNDDGHLYRLAFNKPFYELNGRRSLSAVVHSEEREDRQFQNGFTSNTYQHDIDFASASFGWSAGLRAGRTIRWTAGATLDRHDFAPSTDGVTNATPLDRDFMYPWLGVEIQHDRYTKLTNVDLISTLEDIQLGWQHRLSLGVEGNDVRAGNSVGSHLNWASSNSWQADPHLFRISLSSNGSFGTTADDYYRFSGQIESFIKLSEKFTGYNRTFYAHVNNNYIDRPLTLGGVSGVRGYPFQYQHGESLWASTLELRYYPGNTYYQMFNIAWLAFVDAGEASGQSLFPNEREDILSSVGVGARIHAPRFSGRNVVHINLVHPTSEGADVPDWEFQIQVRRSF